MIRKETTHCQGLLLFESLHSVGQLPKDKLAENDMRGRKKIYRVHVPAARGNVMPEILSINEDFPALWEPMTAI